VLTNCIVSGNRADLGAGMFCEERTNPEIVNCTFVGNAAAMGGGLYVVPKICYPRAMNTVFWGNTATTQGAQIEFTVVPGLPGSSADNLEVLYCDVEGGWSSVGMNKANINVDPGFLDADGPDNDLLTWADNDLSLRPDSQVIDKGKTGKEGTLDPRLSISSERPGPNWHLMTSALTSSTRAQAWHPSERTRRRSISVSVIRAGPSASGTTHGPAAIPGGHHAGK